MTDGEALLRAVLDHPDDDTPRLVYADWLDDHGDPDRAAFIRVQYYLALLPERDARRPALERREQELVTAHGPAWVGEVWPRAGLQDVRFSRGFVAELSLRGTSLGDAGVQALARSPHLGPLRELDVGKNRVTEAGLRALAESPYLSGLRFLDLRENDLSADRFAPMGRWPRLLQVQALYGQAPVQADGRVGEHPFYFRARGNDWEFGLSGSPAVDPTDVYATADAQFYRDWEYGDEPFAASYMPYDHALAVIRRSAEEYRQARGLG